MLCFYDFSIYLSRIYGLLCQSANFQTTYPPSGRVDRLSLPPSPSSGGIGLFLNRHSRQSSLNKGLSPTAAATQSQGHILPQEAGAHGHRDKLRRAFADSAAGASIVNAMGGMGRSSNGLCPPPALRQSSVEMYHVQVVPGRSTENTLPVRAIAKHTERVQPSPICQSAMPPTALWAGPAEKGDRTQRIPLDMAPANRPSSQNDQHRPTYPLSAPGFEARVSVRP